MVRRRREIIDPDARAIVALCKRIGRMTTREKFTFYNIPEDGYMAFAKDGWLVHMDINGVITKIKKL